MRKIVVAISSAAVSSAFATRRLAIASPWAIAAAPVSTATCSRTSAPLPGSSLTDQPGGTTTVVSYSSTSSGPATASPASCARARTGASIVPCTRPEVGPPGRRTVGPGRDPGERERRPARARARPDAAPGCRPASRPRAGSRTAARARPRSARRAPTIDGTSISSPGQLERDAPALAAVADVGDPPPARPPGRRRPVQGAPSASPRRAHGSSSGSPSRARNLAGADIVVLGPGKEQARRREEPGERRHERGPDAELGGERRGVHRAGAAVGDEHEVGRVASLLGRHGAKRAHHRGVRELVDAPGGLERGEPERARRAARAPLRPARARRSGRPRRAGRSGCSRGRRSRR